MLASFGQGSNAIKSAEQGAGLGLPIAKSLVDLHGGTFTLKSKLRIGTEVIVTFPPERVMAALPPLAEPAPPIQPQQARAREADDQPRRQARRSAMRKPAGGCLRGSSTSPIASDCVRRSAAHYRSVAAIRILRADRSPTCHGRHRDPLQQDLHRRPGFAALPRLRAHACRDRGLDGYDATPSAPRIMAELPQRLAAHAADASRAGAT